MNAPNLEWAKEYAKKYPHSSAGKAVQIVLADLLSLRESSSKEIEELRTQRDRAYKEGCNTRNHQFTNLEALCGDMYKALKWSMETMEDLWVTGAIMSHEQLKAARAAMSKYEETHKV